MKATSFPSLGPCRAIFFCPLTHTPLSLHHHYCHLPLTNNMSSNAPPAASISSATPIPTVAATPKANSSKKPKPSISGFDAIASRLLELFHSAARKSTIKTVAGATNLAYKSLRTSFTGSKGAQRKDAPSTPLPSSAAAISPSNKKRRTNSSATSRRSFLPSPVKFSTNDDDDDSYSSDDSPMDDIFSLPRHDDLFLPI